MLQRYRATSIHEGKDESCPILNIIVSIPSLEIRRFHTDLSRCYKTVLLWFTWNSGSSLNGACVVVPQDTDMNCKRNMHVSNQINVLLQ